MAKFKNNDVYLLASIFGAHINNLSRGFTHNSVIFLLNTFRNWSCPGRPDLTEVNLEIQSLLEELVQNSDAKKLTRKQPFRYKLNHSAIFELCKRVVNKNFAYQKEDFFFIFSYLENYSPRTFELMRSKGNYFPFNTKLEIENLLDLNNFIVTHENNCKKELRTLEERIELSEEIDKFTKPLLKRKLDSSDIIKQVEESYPYALHSTLELANFLEEFTDKQVIWEITHGMRLRRQQIWECEIENINLHLKQLGRLKRAYNERNSN